MSEVPALSWNSLSAYVVINRTRMHTTCTATCTRFLSGITHRKEQPAIQFVNDPPPPHFLSPLVPLLSISLGGNTIVPVASEQLPAYLAAPEWQKRHAALIALAQIAEGCSKVLC